MTVLPDFGYQQDNYILDQEDQTSKWKLISKLIEDKGKFQWLMNYIKMKMLQKDINSLEQSNESVRNERAAALRLLTHSSKE